MNRDTKNSLISCCGIVLTGLSVAGLAVDAPRWHHGKANAGEKAAVIFSAVYLFLLFCLCLGGCITKVCEMNSGRFFPDADTTSTDSGVGYQQQSDKSVVAAL